MRKDFDDQTTPTKQREDGDFSSTSSSSPTTMEQQFYTLHKCDTIHSPEKEYRTICIDGNIGSGKTKFMKYFESFPDVFEVIHEPVEKWQKTAAYGNMLNDPEKYAYSFQKMAFRMMNELQKQPPRTRKCIRLIERSALSARYVFTERWVDKGYVSGEQLAEFDREVDELLQQPWFGFDLIVYVNTSPEIAFNRMMRRARKEEIDLDLSYVESLDRLYKRWLLEGRHPRPAQVLEFHGNVQIEADRHAAYDAVRELIAQGYETGKDVERAWTPPGGAMMGAGDAPGRGTLRFMPENV